jgi:hypothetical protein
MAKDDDILRDAIIGTEKEIAASAFDHEEGALDESGDRSLESMGGGLEGQHEPEDDDDDDAENPDEGTDDDEHQKEEPENPDAVEAAGKDKPVDKTQQETQGRVPAGRLREEAEGKRAAIAERDTLKAQLDAEKAANAKAVADLNAKLEGVLAAMQKGTQPQAPQQDNKPQVPDLFENPNAFAEHLNKGVQDRFDAFMKQQRDREVMSSIESARTRHGPVFQEAWKALESLPRDPATGKGTPETLQLVQRLSAEPNPGDAIVSWHKRNVAAREVGDDLDAYKARIAEDTRKALIADPEFRKELLGSLRGDAMIGDQGRPRTVTRLPQSLTRAAGGNSRANDHESFDGSESAIAASAWSD